MSAPPYMKLYVADYLSETTHLGAMSHGAYLLLLMAMWRAGGKLPRDDGKLARIAQCTPEEWAAIRGDVLAYFQVSGGALKHKRVAKEIARYQRVVKGSQKAGLASAAKRANKNSDGPSTDVGQDVQRKTNQPEPEPEPEPEREEDADASSPGEPGEGEAPKGKPSKRKPETPLPDGYPDSAAIAEAQEKFRQAGADASAEHHAERFRNHAQQTDRRCRDWRAAWRNWVLIEVDRAPKKGAPAAASWSGPADVLDAMEDAFPGRGRGYLAVYCVWQDVPSRALIVANEFMRERIQDGAKRQLARIGVEVCPGRAA